MRFILLSFGKALVCLTAARLAQGQTTLPSTITLSPGDNIQSAVDSAPEGTTFVLLDGTYRMQSVRPKNGDTFNGQGATILNGSRILWFRPDPAGSPMWIANATPHQFNPGFCLPAFPRCSSLQDLFIDGVLQDPVDTLDRLKPGSWYFDRARNTVYLDSAPDHHLVELGETTCAFYGKASDVQIIDLIVEKYATPAQQGAIGGNSSVIGWIADRVEVRWNHGRGISLGPRSQILNSWVHHNGQLGISLSGPSTKAIGNEIAWNNYAGYDSGWEAGGSKFWATTNLVVQSNYVHDNIGPGLWTDFDNVDTLYERNTVTNNVGEGIKHEISYNAIIRNNIVKNNEKMPTVWLWNAQIEIQNSSNVQVYGNIVEVPAAGGNGIAIINQKRGAGPLGPWAAAGNYIDRNTITYLGDKGASGLVDDTGGNTAVGNRFDNNHYILLNSGKKHWVWLTAKDWLGFQSVGQESSGRCCN